MNIQEAMSKLNEEQSQAVVHEGSPLLILAGAGSGKTRVITTKIAYLISQKNIEPWSILSVTFTKKAANEMRERAVALDERAADAQIKTFHSFGSWFLRKFYEAAGVVQSFTVYDDSDMETLLKQAAPALSSKEVKTAAKQIALAKDYCLLPEDDLSVIGSEFDLNQIYFDYQKRLHATGNADFGDLIMLPNMIIDQNDEIADYIHNRFKVIMVDEYQDSNIAQFRLLQNLSGVKRDNMNYVCVVGDDDQSIYHFRGAEVQNILSFPQKFPGTQIIKLERNYRSTGKILNAASLVVQKNQDRLGKTLIADRGEGGNPVLAFLPDQNAEATFTAELILKTKEGGAKYSDWAVLYRTNAQSLNFEKEFLHRKIPYVVVGSLKFYEREEIKDTIAYLSLCANPKDEISFRRVVNKPTRGIGEKTQDKIIEKSFVVSENGETSFGNLIETTKKASQEMSAKAKAGAEKFVSIFEILKNSFDKNKKLSEFVERVIKDSGLDEYHKAGDEVEGTTRVQNLQELINSAVPYECSLEGLIAFLDAINLDRSLAAQSEDALDDAVTLITIHNTKGLEYNRVIITGLEEGVFPRQDKTGADLEEERRLFYVGITRAKDELYVTSTSKRCLYGRWEYTRPSPFIKEAASAFKVIGQVPFGFSTGGAGYGYGGYTARTAAEGFKSKLDADKVYGSKNYANKSMNQTMNQKSPVDEELLETFSKGVKLYHDDYGYGMIIKQSVVDEELVILVQFENGEKKKFLPKYQKNHLTVIKD